MLVIGLTGGIGSGKSTVANLFAKHGVPIIDADAVSREITTPNDPAFMRIVKHLGDHVLQPDGSLDRAKLRTIIFADSKERRWLETLLHPLIRDAMQQKINQLSAPYCLAVIPLLLEAEFYFFINRILVVDAPEPLQIERVTARDKAPISHVESILKAQASREVRLTRAHDVITNDGDMQNLIQQVDQLHEKYSHLGNEHIV